jgi:predicted DNA binding protein
MSVTATIHIQHDRLALIPTVQSLQGVDVRVITQVNTDPEVSHFPFLFEYPDRHELEEALDSDPTVEAYELVDWADEQGIYYVEHAPETKLISTVVTEVNGFLVESETTNGGWMVRLLLPDRTALNAIWEYASEHDMSLEIMDVYANEYAVGAESYGLTDEQRTALQAAYEMGYFFEPRETSLEEIAEEMDLSSTAMSGRLRRGIRNLVATTIAEETPDQ